MITEIKNDKSNPFYIKFKLEEKGYLEINDIYDRIEITNIFVNEEYRNQKIASKLIQYLIDYAQDHNRINITLEVNANNSVAIHLYEKYCFNKVAIRKKYYNGVDGILMERKM